jgi:hypothetical protein
VLDPDEADRQEIERRLAAGLTRTRVFGTGVEAEIRRQNLHRLTMRVGALHLANASGLSRTAPAGEIAYGYNGKVATLNARLRETPPSMQGVQIGGDERWVDGTVRIYRDLRFIAQGFTSAYDTTDSQYSSLSSGGSLGTRFTHHSVRFEFRGNHRESSYDTRSVRRTVAMNIGMPIGPLSLNANAERRRQRNVARSAAAIVLSRRPADRARARGGVVGLDANQQWRPRCSAANRRARLDQDARVRAVRRRVGDRVAIQSAATLVSGRPPRCRHRLDSRWWPVSNTRR